MARRSDKRSVHDQSKTASNSTGPAAVMSAVQCWSGAQELARALEAPKAGRTPLVSSCEKNLHSFPNSAETASWLKVPHIMVPPQTSDTIMSWDVQCEARAKVAECTEDTVWSLELRDSTSATSLHLIGLRTCPGLGQPQNRDSI